MLELCRCGVLQVSNMRWWGEEHSGGGTRILRRADRKGLVTPGERDSSRFARIENTSNTYLASFQSQHHGSRRRGGNKQQRASRRRLRGLDAVLS